MTLDPTLVVAGGIGAVFALLSAVMVRLATGREAAQLRRRLQTVASGARLRVPIGGENLAVPAAFARRKGHSEILATLTFGRINGGGWYKSLNGAIERAGLTTTPEHLLVLTLALSLALAVTGRLLLPKLGAVAILGGLVMGPLLVRLVLSAKAGKRRRRFLVLFPDALDLMTRGLRSGLPVAEVLVAISRELPDPVAGVFRELDANVRIGLPLSESLQSVAETIDLQEFRFFAISLVLQQETGGNLAEILQNLSQLLRRRNQMQLKIRAMSSEARASAMIIGALPFVTGAAIYVANPDYIGRLFVDPRGWLLLAMAGGSLLLGVLIMAKLVRFEV